jgi:hypothetical protein
MKARFAFAAALSLSVLASAQSPHTYEQEHPLASGGAVVLMLNVGDVKILPSGSDRIRLDIQTNRPVDQETMAGWIQRFEVAANRATIDIHVPKWEYNCANDCGSGVTLYVPQQSDLQVDLGVGDMTIRGVQGNKDVSTGVGDLRISVANRSNYGHVETHTRIGDVHDFLNQGGGQDGFLGKTEDFTLSGHWHLKASTGIGDVRISQDGKS